MPHWRTPIRQQGTVGVKLANKLQLLSVERFERKKEYLKIWSWYCYCAVTMLLASYGLFRIVEFLLYYVVSPYWKFPLKV